MHHPTSPRLPIILPCLTPPITQPHYHPSHITLTARSHHPSHTPTSSSMFLPSFVDLLLAQSPSPFPHLFHFPIAAAAFKMTGCIGSVCANLFGTYHADNTAALWGVSSATARELAVSGPATSTEGRSCFIKDDNHSIRVVWQSMDSKDGLLPTWSFEQMDPEGQIGIFLQVRSSALAPHLITMDDAWFVNGPGGVVKIQPAHTPRVELVSPVAAPTWADGIHLDNLRRQMYKASHCTRIECQQIVHNRMRAGSW